MPVISPLSKGEAESCDASTPDAQMGESLSNTRYRFIT